MQMLVTRMRFGASVAAQIHRAGQAPVRVFFLRGILAGRVPGLCDASASQPRRDRVSKQARCFCSRPPRSWDHDSLTTTSCSSSDSCCSPGSCSWPAQRPLLLSCDRVRVASSASCTTLRSDPVDLPHWFTVSPLSPGCAPRIALLGSPPSPPPRPPRGARGSATAAGAAFVCLSSFINCTMLMTPSDALYPLESYLQIVCC